jgi:formylglycine-generating enzyme required for sulfatase activity
LSILPAPPPAIPNLKVPHENSLGMRFVASGTENVYFSAWLTRVQDFRAFVEATGYNAADRVLSLKMGVNNEAKLTPTRGIYWARPGFNQTDKHPVCCVSWDDAKKFCSWLTEKEHKDGSLPAGFSYRLPLDAEWRRALCLDPRNGEKPRFPWGKEEQPANFQCNLAGTEIRNGEIPTAWKTFPGYKDPSPFPSPVDFFPANALGIHDMYGNLWQFCEDATGENLDRRLMRGGSWLTSNASDLLLSKPYDRIPSGRGVDAGFRCVIAISNPPPS